MDAETTGVPGRRAFTGVGTVDRAKVQCLSAETQYAATPGYVPTERDFSDMGCCSGRSGWSYRHRRRADLPARIVKPANIHRLQPRKE
jgi:hypothetical protein